MGSQARRPFCLPFLVGKTPASMTFPEFQRADSNSCKSKEEQPGNHLRPCTHPNLVSNPTLLKLQKKEECRTVTALILIAYP